MPLLLYRTRYSHLILLASSLFAPPRQRYYIPTQTSILATMTPPPLKRQKRIAEGVATSQMRNNDKDTTGEIKMPKKKFYRQRAHANPFSDHRLDYPMSPAHMDWTPHFPSFVDPDPSNVNLSGARKLLKDVEVVDIGCGYGGLLIGLAPLLPETLMLGMEIRTQVLDYLRTRIQALRYQQSQLKNEPQQQPSQQPPSTTSTETQSASTQTASETQFTADGLPTSIVPGNFENIFALRSNTMKFLPNFFSRHQLSKIFICFPDPHFKMRKHKARIISETLNAEYAYVLRPGGLMYTITDVEEYHHWILRHFRQDEESGAGPGVTDLFERVSEEELERDPSVQVMKDATEEGKKVTRNKGHKFVAVFRRKADPEWPA